MAERRFKKAPGYVGKHLSLYNGTADRTVHDGVTLYGERWAKFVQLGFLQEITEAEDKPEPKLTLPKATPKVKGTPVKDGESTALVPPAEGSTTKSPADRVDAAVGAVSTLIRKGKGKK